MTDFKFATMLLCFILVFGIGAAIVQAVMEARTFRKLSGRTDVTWFDALWVELRVIECKP